MALTAEMSIDTEIFSANCLKNAPVMPPKKALGSSTELRTRVMARIGPVISFMALIVASRTGRPFSSQRSMFSSTTIASSTTMPMASTSPNSVSVLSVKPSSFITTKVPTSDTDMSITGKSRAFQSCRKSRMTRATKTTDSRSVSKTSLTDSRMKGVVS